MTIAEAQAQLARTLGTPGEATAPIDPALEGFDWNPDVDRDDEAECAYLRRRVDTLTQLRANADRRCAELVADVQRVQAENAALRAELQRVRTAACSS